MSLRSWLGFLMLATLAACGPSIDGLERGEKGRVVRVADGNRIVLDSGLVVILVGIEPPPASDSTAARAAKTALERLVLNREVQLAYGGERRYHVAAQQDRPASEAAMAQVYVRNNPVDWTWVQEALVRDGVVYARTRRGNVARAAELSAVEREAREAMRGIWMSRDYQVRTPDAIASEVAAFPSTGSCAAAPFRVVQGTVRRVIVEPTRALFMFGLPAESNMDFTAGVFGENFSTWDGQDLRSFQGKEVMLRGNVLSRQGPLMCVDHAQQIEIIGEGAPPPRRERATPSPSPGTAPASPQGSN